LHTSHALSFGMHFNKSEAREKVTGKRCFCSMNFGQARFSLMPKCFMMKADTCPHFRKIADCRA